MMLGFPHPALAKAHLPPGRPAVEGWLCPLRALSGLQVSEEGEGGPRRVPPLAPTGAAASVREDAETCLWVSGGSAALPPQGPPVGCAARVGLAWGTRAEFLSVVRCRPSADGAGGTAFIARSARVADPRPECRSVLSNLTGGGFSFCLFVVNRNQVFFYRRDFPGFSLSQVSFFTL